MKNSEGNDEKIIELYNLIAQQRKTIDDLNKMNKELTKTVFLSINKNI